MRSTCNAAHRAYGDPSSRGPSRETAGMEEIQQLEKRAAMHFVMALACPGCEAGCHADVASLGDDHIIRSNARIVEASGCSEEGNRHDGYHSHGGCVELAGAGITVCRPMKRVPPSDQVRVERPGVRHSRV